MMNLEAVSSQFALATMFIACVLGALGALFVGKYGGMCGLLDKPCERSSHVKVTPKGGGLGILVGFLVIAYVLRPPFSFWLPAAIVSVLSLFGDRVHLSQLLRLSIQSLCAFSLVAGCLLQNQTQPHWVSWILTAALCAALAVYAVGTANFFNFMDGINGIAGLTGLVGFAGLAFYAHYVRGISTGHVPLLSLCLGAGCLGFLPFNCPKARVFLGDVGSILLGFLFAGCVIVLSDSLLDFVCLNSFLFPFYADELSTMMVRIRSRDNLLQPHRRHVYQILANQMGIPHWKVSVLYVVMQLVVSGTALLLRPSSAIAVLAFLGSAFSLFACAGNYLRRWEFASASFKEP